MTGTSYAAAIGMLLLLTGCVVTPSSSAPACGGVAFAAEKIKATTGPATNPENPATPDEIRAIRKGSYVETAHMLSGGAGWTAFDLDQGYAIQVTRYAGEWASRVPSVAQPTADKYTRPGRYERPGRRAMEWVDLVTRKKLTAEEAERIVCSANRLWLDQETYNPAHRTDTFAKFLLIDGMQIKQFSGFGTLPPRVNAFNTELTDMISPPVKK